MRLSWWKYLGMALILYAVLFGMLVPLKPGLVSLERNSYDADQPMEVIVNGYNTSFSHQSEKTRAWLKLDDGSILQASSTQAINDNRLRLNFEPHPVPSSEKIITATVIVDHATDKSMVLPGALFMNQSGNTASGRRTKWKSARPQDLSAKEGFFFPYRNILMETIRNIYYHVSIWFAMFLLLLVSVYKSIMYLRTKDLAYDAETNALVQVGVLYGLMGLATGSVWAKYTWGTWWTTDVKLNMAAISMLIYLGYLLLRSSVSDRERKASISASYSIFAYVAMIPLLFVVPRMTDSLHPGNGGNPALGGEDLDHTMRLVFYPAIIGFTLIGLWMAEIKWRIEKVLLKKLGL